MSGRKYKHVDLISEENTDGKSTTIEEDGFVNDGPQKMKRGKEMDDNDEDGIAFDIGGLEHEQNPPPSSFLSFLDLSEKQRRYLMYAMIIISGLLIIIMISSFAVGEKHGEKVPRHKDNHNIEFDCAFDNEIQRPLTYDFIEYYEAINTRNNDVTKFKEWENVDGINDKYEDRKSKLSDWKISQFSSLKSGDSIYESATGLGTNLALTLEILEETKGISNLKIYGNDMIESSVNRAEDLFTKNNIAGSTIGKLCRGDSTHLFFVPSNAFDLAFSGYLDPLDDPLEFDEAVGQDRYENLCTLTNSGDWHLRKLSKLAQKKQEEWFSSWISELIRITKPGGTIVVEDVGKPYCMDQNDWGGVERNWWLEAKDHYDWNIVEDSISIVDSSEGAPEGRYHVSMKKVQTLE